MPTTLSMIRTIFPDPKERAKAPAVWSIVSGLGAIVGPVVGGALLEVFNWHSAFLIHVPFVIVAIVAGALLLPEARDPRPPRWDVVATVLSIAGMSLLVWGIKQLAKEGWGDVPARTAALTAAALMTWFVRRCLAVLGSVAAALYRQHLDIATFTAAGLPGDLGATAGDSLVGALDVARQTGLDDLAAVATTAFVDSLGQTSLIGGLIMLATSVVAYPLVPRSYDLASAGSH